MFTATIITPIVLIYSQYNSSVIGFICYICIFCFVLYVADCSTEPRQNHTMNELKDEELCNSNIRYFFLFFDYFHFDSTLNWIHMEKNVNVWLCYLSETYRRNYENQLPLFRHHLKPKKKMENSSDYIENCILRVKWSKGYDDLLHDL